MKNVWLAVAMVAVAGCGANEAEVTEGSDLLGEQSGELSTTSRTYVTFTHDMRKCASPMCGGYFVTDVNRLNPAPRYVNAIDFSKSGLDDAAVEKALGGATATVLRGKLGAEEPAFHTRPFIVTDAWRGMPGVTEATGDSFFLVDAVNVQCIKAPCPTMKATRLNAGGATMIHQTSVARRGADGRRPQLAHPPRRAERRDRLGTLHPGRAGLGDTREGAHRGPGLPEAARSAGPVPALQDGAVPQRPGPAVDAHRGSLRAPDGGLHPPDCLHPVPDRLPRGLHAAELDRRGQGVPRVRLRS
jgi:hypothetical protein